MWLIDSLKKLLQPQSAGTPADVDLSPEPEIDGAPVALGFESSRDGEESAPAFPMDRPCSADSLGVLSFSVNEPKKFRKVQENGKELLYIKANKLLPRRNPDTQRLELSTFCVDGISQDAVPAFLADSTGGNSVGCLDFQPAEFTGLGLRLDPNWEPHRHVDVYEWPAEEDAQKALVMQLSSIRPGVLWTAN